MTVDRFPLWQPAILVLLAERPSHGWELSKRVAALGLGEAHLPASLYSKLRAMESDGLIDSAWEVSAGGPPRRVYRCTGTGRAWLDGSIAAVARHRDALGAMLDVYEALV